MKRELTHLGMAVLAGSIVAMAVSRDGLGVFVTTPFLALALAFDRMPRRVPALFNLIFLVGALVADLGYSFNLYQRVEWFDMFPHSLASAGITVTLGRLLFYRAQRKLADHPGLYALALGATCLAVGVAWEMFELTIGIIGDLRDTLKDLAMDSVGASVGALIASFAITGPDSGETRLETTGPREALFHR